MKKYCIILNDKTLTAKHYIKSIKVSRNSVEVLYTLSKLEALNIEYTSALSFVIILENAFNNEAYNIEKAE